MYRPTPSFIVASAALFTVAIILLALSGCATTPTDQQKLGATTVIDTAVIVAVQNGTSDPVVWADRAGKILSVTKQLQALDSGDVTTLAALTAALDPMIQKLNLAPAEQIAAKSLIVALTQVIQQQSGNIDANVQVAIKFTLQTVSDAAKLYVPKSAGS